MGYTHYWAVQRDFTEEEWSKLLHYAKNLLNNNPRLDIYSLDKDLIHFNGKESCEDLYLPREVNNYSDFGRQVGKEQGAQAWDFCKTRRLGYDFHVIRILEAANQISNGNLTMSSDGGDEVFEEIRAEVAEVLQ